MTRQAHKITTALTNIQTDIRAVIGPLVSIGCPSHEIEALRNANALLEAIKQKVSEH